MKIQPTSSSSRRRVAVLALYGEYNMGVPPVPVDAIHWLLDVRSADLLSSLMRDDSFALPEMWAFVNAMDAADVEIVPVRSAVAASGPPFPAERIFEVAAPGATSPVIAAFPYRNIQRPIWPLDPNLVWHPEDDVMCATPDHRWTRLAEVA